jgi:hypothetical protein
MINNTACNCAAAFVPQAGMPDVISDTSNTIAGCKLDLAYVPQAKNVVLVALDMIAKNAGPALSITQYWDGQT